VTSPAEPVGVENHSVDRVTELGGGWPGWVLRVVVLLAGAGALAVQEPAGVEIGVLIGMAVLAVLSAVVPSTPAPAVLIAAVIVVVTAHSGDPLRWSVLAEIPLLHLIHTATALSAIIPVRALVAPAALRRPATRFLAVQAAAFAVVGFAALLPADRNPAVVEIAGLLGATALSLLAIRLLRTKP
jgi:hypothetical protein